MACGHRLRRNRLLRQRKSGIAPGGGRKRPFLAPQNDFRKNFAGSPPEPSVAFLGHLWPFFRVGLAGGVRGGYTADRVYIQKSHDREIDGETYIQKPGESMIDLTDFEWDDEKNNANFRKHGVDFLGAARVFADPVRLDKRDTAHSKHEERRITIGFSSPEILTVVYTVRMQDTIRIISARKATKNEEKSYYKSHARP
jgi:uncharacterized DUF497 family protein